LEVSFHVFCLMRHLIAKRDLQAMVRKKLAYLFDAVFMSPARDFADNDWIYAVLSTGAGAMGGASVLLAPPASSLLGQVSRRLVGCAGDVILACSLRCLINQCVPADLSPSRFRDLSRYRLLYCYSIHPAALSFHSHTGGHTHTSSAVPP
jgi:hypothetical protein